MNTAEIQQLKMAWLAAKEAGDTQEQTRLLREHPEAQDALIDFIAAYSATGGLDVEQDAQDMPLLTLTQRALQSALDRVFASALAPALTVSTLGELRRSRKLSKLDVAKGLRLGVDVWSKFEAGTIELVSLSQRQLARLASFFQISADQFATLLTSSQPSISLNRRQTREAANQEQTNRQHFAEAIARSDMSEEEKQLWLDGEA